MTSLLNIFNFGAGAEISSGKDANLFSTLANGGSGLQSGWDPFANFGGAFLMFIAVAFLIIAVAKSRDKAKWFWYAGIAFVVGAVLMVSGNVGKIAGGFGNTYDNVFSGKAITFITTNALDIVHPLLHAFGF